VAIGITAGRWCGRLLSSLVWSMAPEHEGTFDLLDGFGDLAAAGAGFGAVEGGAATPHTFGVGADSQPLLAALVAGAEVKDQPVALTIAVGPT